MYIKVDIHIQTIKVVIIKLLELCKVESKISFFVFLVDEFSY